MNFYLQGGVIFINLPQKQLTILIIDSDVSFTNILSTRLGNVGFNILVANSYELSIKLMRISRPDIILLDLIVKSNNGKDILTQIKSNSKLSKVPVIILSSDVDINSKVHGFLSGANDYIVKPFRFEELLARINTQFRILSMQKELENKNKELIQKNILLEKLAITDSLTGLYNRGHVLNRLKSEILRSARYKESLSFMMIDIDHFKNINDSYGHLTGDAILKIISNVIKNSVRDIDIVGRYGGEEFIVICPNTDSIGASVVAERIRKNALRTCLEYNSKKISASLSIGLSSSIPKLHVNIDAFINKQINDADIALYKAKTEGRNKVVIFESLKDYSSLNITDIKEDAVSQKN